MDIIKSLDSRVDWATVAAVVLVLVATAVALRLLAIAVRGVAQGILQRDREPAREVAQKAKTLSQFVEATGRIAILTVAGLTVLTLTGRDVTPLLASAGIVGVSLGFGSQNLIKDWITLPPPGQHRQDRHRHAALPDQPLVGLLLPPTSQHQIDSSFAVG